MSSSTARPPDPAPDGHETPPAGSPSGPGDSSAPDGALAPLADRGRSRPVGFRTHGAEAAIRLTGLALRRLPVHAGGWLLDRLRRPEARAVRADARLRTTLQAAVRVLGILKGAFVKAGQFAAVRHDLLPPGASEPLALLQSRVPPLPFETVREAVERELRAPLEELFESFDPQPLGAASIAQAHRARLPGGLDVAVKVQYPWVRASLPADLKMLDRLLRWGAWWRGQRIPEREALVEEFRTGLLEELDFEREARVAGEIAANLAGDPQIAVPRVIADRSTRRVLTMSYCDAIPIDDFAALDARGISRAAVLQVLARAYARQIFEDGLFHADPHPGNLFVVDEPEAHERPRVLFVDFGLSKRLSPALRRHIRQGIYALLQLDLDAFVARMDAMGMIAPGAHPGVRDAVERMFERIRERGGALSVPGQAILGLKEEAKELLRETPGLQLPNDLLLYARTLTYLFALGDRLAPEVDLVKLSTPYLLKFLAEKD
jgi:ubiquinone biosynthesis protein